MSASIKAGLNNDMHLMTDGVTRAYVDGNGKVGIGTDSPDRDLHVNGTVTNSKAFARFTHDGLASTGLDVGYSSGGYASIYNAENTATVFSTNATERMRINASGYVTKPNQPGFNVRFNTSNSTSPTGIDTVKFTQIVTNIGSHYSTSTGRFTAPVSGFYQFNLSMYFQNGTNYVGSMLQKSDGTIYYNFSSVGPDVFVYTSQAVYLNQNDYMYTRTYCGGATTTVRQYSYFSGYLIG